MTPPEATAPRPSAPTIHDVRMHDTLASSNRLWVRGQLLFSAEITAVHQRRWWNRWGKAAPPLLAVPAVHIHTQISGVNLEADVPVRPDGYFETSFEAELPPARRGWRMARHQITVADQTVRACNVVLPDSWYAAAWVCSSLCRWNSLMKRTACSA